MQIGNLDLAKRKAEDTLKIDANYRPALQLLDTVRQMLRNIKPNRPASKPSGTPSRFQCLLAVKNLRIKRFFRRPHDVFSESSARYFNRRTLISVGAFFFLLHRSTRVTHLGKIGHNR